MLPQRGTNPMQRKLYSDIKYRLPALLHVEDRTSMAASIESRVPFLDYRLVELASSIPEGLKLARGRTKHILRKSLNGVVPRAILARSDKNGFAVPLERWFNGPLNRFAREIIDSKTSRERGVLSETAARSAFKNDGPRIWATEIWKMLSIEMWYRVFIDRPCVEDVAPAFS